jgi:membrane protease YdiL (CAAX protease family)
MQTIPDCLVAILLVSAFLGWGRYLIKSIKTAEPPDLPIIRTRAYLGTVALQWLFVISVAAIWVAQRRAWTDLGVIPVLGTPLWAFLGLLVVVMVVVLPWRSHLLAKPETLQKLHEVSEGSGPGRLFPKTRTELTRFYVMSISSGITEEVLFRGFLTWCFHHWFPFWVAALLSTILFALGHLYQGAGGAMQAGILGAVFMALYAWTGSLLPPVFLHILVNLHQTHAVQLGMSYSRHVAQESATGMAIPHPTIR